MFVVVVAAAADAAVVSSAAEEPLGMLKPEAPLTTDVRLTTEELLSEGTAFSMLAFSAPAFTMTAFLAPTSSMMPLPETALFTMMLLVASFSTSTHSGVVHEDGARRCHS